ncbi:hypothetical protein RHGRI_019212 [Rhododendron griersonianum]|uniref:Uncharacterized protein n=1 Tax=Rhododendron griersonianum TaxID=479676 RepID=A0AAV6JGF5_9ERIC|nr:hypothetical protein RHGRI_019212 [Rhododendron griersonianum]
MQISAVSSTSYEYTVLLELLKKGHLEPEKKIGEGILAFQVRYHPQWKSRCFFLVRNDETVDDFSFRKCVDHILPLPENMQIKSDVNKALGGGGRGHGGRGGGGRGSGHGRGRGRGGRGRGGSSKSSIQDFESSSYPPPLACEAECQLTENSKGEDDHNLRDNEDFLPRFVLPLLLEYFHDDGDGFHDGCDGYKEDNEGDDTGVCGGVDGDDDHVNKEEEDFKRRIEEFIAKTNKIWREELLTDKLLCITTTAYE